LQLHFRSCKKVILLTTLNVILLTIFKGTEGTCSGTVMEVPNKSEAREQTTTLRITKNLLARKERNPTLDMNRAPFLLLIKISSTNLLNAQRPTPNAQRPTNDTEQNTPKYELEHGY
jgi:hypothetical protein